MPCVLHSCACVTALPGRASWCAPTNFRDSPHFPVIDSLEFPKEFLMKSTSKKPCLPVRLLLAAGALCSTAAMAAGPDEAYAGWLGSEFTVLSSSQRDHVPLGGKLTLVYDAEDDVVRVCARSVPTKRATWRMDLAVPCMVALNFVRGTRYCSEADVKAGDAETLASCHRLRSNDVAMHP